MFRILFQYETSLVLLLKKIYKFVQIMDEYKHIYAKDKNITDLCRATEFFGM